MPSTKNNEGPTYLQPRYAPNVRVNAFSRDPLTGLFFLQGEQYAYRCRKHQSVAIPLRGFSFCNRKIRHGLQATAKSLRCNPLTGLFFLQVHAWLRRAARRSHDVAIPLRGFSFCKCANAGISYSQVRSTGCNPLTGLFFLQAQHPAPLYELACEVAIPLRGFSFCKLGAPGVREGGR